jgi:hypothetical protein
LSDAPESETHEGHAVIGDIRTLDAPEGIGLPALKFVHYPGAQQLVLWLPQSGYHGYGDLTVMRGDDVIEHGPVQSRLNGSVQILFDTLRWPPGDYAVVITHEDGWRHEANLQKLEAGVAPPAPEPPPPPSPRGNPDKPIVYRDGFGNVIADIDLEIRGKAQAQLERQFGRRVEYDGNVRAGTVIYIDPVHRIVFSNEMCGGGIKVSIEIPSAAHWVKATGAPLAMRDDIVAFVAASVQRDQASSWQYRITDTSIDFY